MSGLERAWREWRSLSRRDRAAFIALLRQDCARQRAAAVRRRGGGRGERGSPLADLALTKTDLQRLGPQRGPLMGFPGAG